LRELRFLLFYINSVRFILFFAVSLVASASYGASLIGTDALGMERAPQNAAIIKNGFFSQNPAVNAFENKTKFGAVIQYEYAEAQEGNSYAISLNSFTTPSLSMILPLGFLGTLGIGLEQKYLANNRLELIDAALNSNVSLSSRVGIYEIVPSYSIRLPFFLNDFAVGASYRILFGNSYSSLVRGRDDSWDEYSWISNRILITKKESGSFETNSDWWRNFGYSIHFHRKSVDYFVSYFPSIQVQKSIRENIQFSNTDTLQLAKRIEDFKLPARFASGVHFCFWQNQNLSLIYEQQNFEETEFADAETQKSFFYFAEYRISGTGLYYSPFFARNNFGANAWYAEKYLKDVKEYGASLFSDLWLGRRGTLLGLAFFGGYRQAKKPYWDEPFFGIKFSLTGVGNWGTSSRRK